MTQAASGDAVIEEVDPDAQDVQQTTETTGDTPAGEGGEAGATGTEGSDDEVVVSLGESPNPEEDESRAPEWVRELRKSNREKDRKLREQEAEITRLKGAGTTQPATVTVGEKPTLEGCNYDAAKFEADLEAWHTRKREADAQKEKKDAEQKKQQDAWQATLQAYGQEKSELKVKDFDEAEDVVRDTLSVVQQGVILDGVDKGRRAALIYALGKNPVKCKELAAIDNPVKFAFAVAKLETQLKVTPRKSAPAPERRVSSTVAGAAAVDNQLEKLREEARKTGDLSKVVAYQRQQRRGN